MVGFVNYSAYLCFDMYNLVVYGSISSIDGIDNIVLDFIVEAVIPLFNFIFYFSSNTDQIKCLKNDKKKEGDDKELCTFLSSSLNVELVYIILTSVVEFVKDRQFWSQADGCSGSLGVAGDSS